MTNSKRILLICSLTKESVRQFVIKPGERRSIGRNPKQASFVFKDKLSMSGKHFEIFNVDGACVEFRDLGSANGTFVDGEKVAFMILKGHEIIKAGNVEFKLSWVEEKSAIECEASIQPPIAVEQVRATSEISEVPQEHSSPVPAPIHQSAPTSGASNPAPLQAARSGVFEPPPVAPKANGAVEKSDAVQKSAVQDSSNQVSHANEPVAEVKQASLPAPPLQVTNPPKSAMSTQASQASSSPVQVTPKNEQSWKAKKNKTTHGSRYKSGISSLNSGGNQVPNPQIRLGDSLECSFYDLQRQNESFHDVLDKVAGLLEFYVVAHFRKIGMSTPEYLEVFPLLPFLDGGREHMPVAISKREWMQRAEKEWSTLLYENDGIMLVPTLFPTKTPEALVQMGQSSLPGVSRSGGFIGWFWPSQLQWMFSGLTRARIDQWCSPEVGGFIFPSLNRQIESRSRSEIAMMLQRCGFRSL